MSEKILITYASRLGSTAEVAQAIAQTLHDRGQKADLETVTSAQNIEDYDIVIVGSAIRYGHWLPDAVAFVAANQKHLNRIPTVFFTVCMTVAHETTENRLKVQQYLDPVRALVTPVDEVWFAGRLDYAQLTFMQRVIGKIQGLPAGDFRDWGQIRDWADHIL